MAHQKVEIIKKEITYNSRIMSKNIYFAGGLNGRALERVFNNFRFNPY